MRWHLFSSFLFCTFIALHKQYLHVHFLRGQKAHYQLVIAFQHQLHVYQRSPVVDLSILYPTVQSNLKEYPVSKYNKEYPVSEYSKCPPLSHNYVNIKYYSIIPSQNALQRYTVLRSRSERVPKAFQWRSERCQKERSGFGSKRSSDIVIYRLKLTAKQTARLDHCWAGRQWYMKIQSSNKWFSWSRIFKFQS